MKAPARKEPGSALDDVLLLRVRQDSLVTSKATSLSTRFLFPLGLIKLLLGCLLLVCGLLALLRGASLAHLGGGLWCGGCVLVSGTLAVALCRRPHSHAVLISFLAVAIISLTVSALLAIFSATGLIKDTAGFRAIYVNTESGVPLEFLGTLAVRRPAVVLNSALVAAGALDMLLSLLAVVLVTRELCWCGGGQPAPLASTVRLLPVLWLGRAPGGDVVHQVAGSADPQLPAVPSLSPSPTSLLAPPAAHTPRHLGPGDAGHSSSDDGRPNELVTSQRRHERRPRRLTSPAYSDRSGDFAARTLSRRRHSPSSPDMAPRRRHSQGSVGRIPGRRHSAESRDGGGQRRGGGGSLARTPGRCRSPPSRGLSVQRSHTSSTRESPESGQSRGRGRRRTREETESESGRSADSGRLVRGAADSCLLARDRDVSEEVIATSRQPPLDCASLSDSLDSQQ